MDPEDQKTYVQLALSALENELAEPLFARKAFIHVLTKVGSANQAISIDEVWARPQFNSENVAPFLEELNQTSASMERVLSKKSADPSAMLGETHIRELGKSHSRVFHFKLVMLALSEVGQALEIALGGEPNDYDQIAFHLVRAATAAESSSRADALYAYHKVISGEASVVARKAGEKSAKRFEVAREMVREISSCRWSGKDETSIGLMAREMVEVIRADPEKLGLDSGSIPTVATVKRWIVDFAPTEARRRGRPKKK